MVFWIYLLKRSNRKHILIFLYDHVIGSNQIKYLLKISNNWAASTWNIYVMGCRRGQRISKGGGRDFKCCVQENFEKLTLSGAFSDPPSDRLCLLVWGWLDIYSQSIISWPQIIGWKQFRQIFSDSRNKHHFQGGAPILFEKISFFLSCYLSR